ncbi:MAG: NAD(P)-dependent oxidoreductase [Byssovorax sp.]
MIALLGTGLLGSGFARAFLRRGVEVQVYNRTLAKAEALVEAGAKAFGDPAEAVRGADRIHLVLSDDAAVDDVLERARPGFAPGVLLVDHSTTSSTGVQARAARWAERGVEFLHAPVFMTPQNALEGTGVMLASGDAARVERLRPELEKMTGKLLFLGPEPERAAAFKLFGNLFLMFMTAGVTEVLTLAKALDVKPEEATALFDSWNPAALLTARVKRILGADFAHPSWELAMARKDARLMLEEGERHGVPLPMLPAIAAEMDRYLARGHAHDDWTVIAKDALAR